MTRDAFLWWSEIWRFFSFFQSPPPSSTHFSVPQKCLKSTYPPRSYAPLPQKKLPQHSLAYMKIQTSKTMVRMMYYSREWHRHTRKKEIQVLLSGVEPKTFRLLVRMLYHWATGDSWELSMPVSLSGIIHHSHSFTRLEIYHHTIS